MTITYRTVVLHLPPTPLGLLPERWAVEHWCNACRQRVTSDQLVAHARDHDSTDDFAGGYFPPASAPCTMTPDLIEPNSAEEVSRG
jgi:hypothetical protein